MRTPEKVDVKGKDEIQPLGDRDLVCSSGVLHYIAVNERAKWMSGAGGIASAGWHVCDLGKQSVEFTNAFYFSVFFLRQ